MTRRSWFGLIAGAFAGKAMPTSKADRAIAVLPARPEVQILSTWPVLYGPSITTTITTASSSDPRIIAGQP